MKISLSGETAAQRQKFLAVKPMSVDKKRGHSSGNSLWGITCWAPSGSPALCSFLMRTPDPGMSTNPHLILLPSPQGSTTSKCSGSQGHSSVGEGCPLSQLVNNIEVYQTQGPLKLSTRTMGFNETPSNPIMPNSPGVGPGPNNRLYGCAPNRPHS